VYVLTLSRDCQLSKIGLYTSIIIEAISIFFRFMIWKVTWSSCYFSIRVSCDF